MGPRTPDLPRRNGPSLSAEPPLRNTDESHSRQGTAPCAPFSRRFLLPRALTPARTTAAFETQFKHRVKQKAAHDFLM